MTTEKTSGEGFNYIIVSEENCKGCDYEGDCIKSEGSKCYTTPPAKTRESIPSHISRKPCEVCKYAIEKICCSTQTQNACQAYGAWSKLSKQVKPEPVGDDRHKLWLNHGCNGRPYGDDGEMQCCGIDFKRTDICKIVQSLIQTARREGVRAGHCLERAHIIGLINEYGAEHSGLVDYINKYGAKLDTLKP